EIAQASGRRYFGPNFQSPGGLSLRMHCRKSEDHKSDIVGAASKPASIFPRPLWAGGSGRGLAPEGANDSCKLSALPRRLPSLRPQIRRQEMLGPHPTITSTSAIASLKTPDH